MTKKKALTSWIKPLTGVPCVALFPTQALLDPEMRPRQLKVLGVLCAHAKRDGSIASIGQARIAELAGLSDAQLVSRLIFNPAYGTPSDRLGPGLIQLGYLKCFGQLTRTSTNGYQLATPEAPEGVITRPDGETAKLNRALSRKVSDEQHAKNREALAAEQAVRAKKSAAKRTTEFEFEGELFLRERVQESIYRNGPVLVYPPQVYRGLGLLVPVEVAELQEVPIQALEQRADPEQGVDVGQELADAIAAFELKADAGALEIDGRDYTREDVLRDIDDYHEGFEFAVPVDVYYHFRFQRPTRRQCQY